MSESEVRLENKKSRSLMTNCSKRKKNRFNKKEISIFKNLF